MSGHSHWAGIKHKKGVVDAKRGKAFSKVAKLISTAARNGGGDPSMNLRLKYAIDSARQANMPKENIERAIQSGTGQLPGQVLEEVLYEAYGPGGVGILLAILTDNRNRTAAEIRKLLERQGGSLAASGSVAWQFETKALLLVEAPADAEEKLLEAVLDAGAEDLTSLGDTFEITAEPESLEPMRKAAEEAGFRVSSAEIANLPKNRVALDDAGGRKAIRLLLALEDHDDVLKVDTNYDAPESLLDEVQEAAGG